MMHFRPKTLTQSTMCTVQRYKMAIREGNYVGGHEIIERQVGSRLVWEKLDLIIETKESYYKAGNEVRFVWITSSPSSDIRLFESANSIMIAGTLFSKITITHLYSDTSDNILKTLYFIITFRDYIQHSAFMSLLNLNNSVDNGTFEVKIFKKKR